MRRKGLLCAVLLLLGTQAAHASPACLASVPDAALVGRGVLTYAVWDVYEASLYAPQGQWSPDAPYALAITYRRAIDSSAIVDTSIKEIKRQGVADSSKLDAWQSALTEIIPDVAPGTSLCAAHNQQGQTVFYKGDDKIDTVEDKAFGRFFFGIWLSDGTSKPRLRKALLGQS